MPAGTMERWSTGPDQAGARGVLDLMRTQASLYARLEDFAQHQRNLVTREDCTPLLAVLAERQKISAELALLGTQLAPVRQTWDSFRRGLDPAEQREADRLVAETSACLRRVIESDEQDVRRLSARRQLAVDGLRATRARGSAMAAYRGLTASASVRPSRLDEAT